MADQETIVFDEADVSDNKVLAILMVIFPILFFLPLVMDDKKNSAFLKFYANQALVYLIAGAATGVITSVLSVIIIGFIVGPVLGIFLTVCWIILLIGACKGEAKVMPLIGKITILK